VKKAMMITIGLIIAFSLFWTGSIIKCEILTALHADEFLGLDEVSSAEKFKVLTYNDGHARLYCVATNYESGSIFAFTKENNEWKFSRWEDGVWSKSGTADGFVWPYIR